jgi:hypothetical protein
VVASIHAGAAQDAALNPSNASTSIDDSVNFSTTGTTAPDVTINQASSQTDPTSSSPVEFTVVFSELVTGFDASDVDLSASTAGGTLVALVTGSEANYTVDVSGMTTSGTVVASIHAGAAQDVALHPSNASTSIDDSITFSSTADTTPPDVTIDQASSQTDPTSTSPVEFTVTFSEPVTGFDASDIDLSGSTAGGTLVALVTGSGANYTVDVSGMTTSGTVVASIHAGAAQDAALNPSNASTSIDDSVTFDAAPASPTLVLLHDTGISGSDGITSDPSITFSTPASGDTLFYKVDGGGFSATVPAFATDHSADGPHTVSVEEQDTGGNVSPVSSLTFTLDTTPPLVTGIAAMPGSGGVFTGSTVELTLGFNEAVNVSGGTPSLSLNDGATASYDAAATALLGDASKLVFDYLVGANDQTPSLAVTGLTPNGATVSDLAGNAANLSSVTAAFNALSVNETVTPAYTVNGITRPALELDSTGHIILDPAAASFAAEYGMKYLYLGLQASTPYPPVADTHLDFHLV